MAKLKDQEICKKLVLQDRLSKKMLGWLVTCLIGLFGWFGVMVGIGWLVFHVCLSLFSCVCSCVFAFLSVMLVVQTEAMEDRRFQLQAIASSHSQLMGCRNPSHEEVELPAEGNPFASGGPCFRSLVRYLAKGGVLNSICVFDWGLLS